MLRMPRDGPVMSIAESTMSYASYRAQVRRAASDESPQDLHRRAARLSGRLLDVAAKPPCTTREDAAGGCDGVRNGFWGFCTSREANPWWQVDLGRSLRLDRIVIYNRCDGRVEGRAARLQVLLSGDGRTWAERYQHDGKPFFGHTDGKPLVVPLKGASARFVRIRLPATEYLHLDEVEVYAAGSDANVALREPADQSSVSPWSFKGPAEPKAR